MPTNPSDSSSSRNSKDTNALDALRSPAAPEFTEIHSERQSVVTDSDFNEINLDDDAGTSSGPPKRLSLDMDTIPLDAEKTPMPPPLSPPLITPTLPRTHKKTASTTTIRSGTNLPFILSRLDETDPTGKSQRGSLDGHQKLQEEFARLHKEGEADGNDTGANIDWDFWGAVISDYQGFASEHAEELAKAIAKGIPDTLRGMMWQHMAASKDPDLEATYLKLLKESSPHEKAITRDLGRTFPHHEFFNDGQGIGQENLFNVLKAYSLYDTQVGYCQGLPFVVAILLLNMPDEEAFSLLVRLMFTYDLRGHFLPEMPKLQLRLFQFDRLIEELLPVLHHHFLRQGIKSSMFCSQWFLTIFSYKFPMSVVFRIYDNCLASGIEAIFGFSIILLKKNEDLLLSLKFDEILNFLNTKLFDRYKILPEGEPEEKDQAIQYNVDEFVQEAVALPISPFMLDNYRHEYEDHVRETTKHATEMDELRNSNRSLSAQVKSLENSLAQLNTEHVELLVRNLMPVLLGERGTKSDQNELVKSRLRNEEMEEQLVRYKLLYAEAMHENQDAQSSQRISVSQLFRLKRGSSS